jgi:hypothetical protein
MMALDGADPNFGLKSLTTVIAGVAFTAMTRSLWKALDEAGRGLSRLGILGLIATKAVFSYMCAVGAALLLVTYSDGFTNE